MYVCACVNVYECMYVYECVCMFMYVYAYMCLCIYLYMCAWICMCMCVCGCICICLRAHECGNQEKDFGHHFLSKIHLSLLNFYGGWVVRQPVAHFVG